jgi:hypothetical protein
MTNRRPFIITPYHAGDDGRLRPKIPCACPHSVTTGAGGRCKISVRHRRSRKTGPGFPLFVVDCELHECTFTLYPPGFAPYQRCAVALVTACGQQMLGEGSLDVDDDLTMFDNGAKQRGKDDQRTRHSRRRNARIVGVAGVADRLREVIASVLSVPTLTLRSLSRSCGSISEAVDRVLRQLRGTAQSKATMLLVSGHLAGCWGEPLAYDAERRTLRRSPYCSPFRLLERRASATSHFRRTGPTKGGRDHDPRQRGHSPPVHRTRSLPIDPVSTGVTS